MEKCKKCGYEFSDFRKETFLADAHTLRCNPLTGGDPECFKVNSQQFRMATIKNMADKIIDTVERASKNMTCKEDFKLAQLQKIRAQVLKQEIEALQHEYKFTQRTLNTYADCVKRDLSYRQMQQ